MAIDPKMIDELVFKKDWIWDPPNELIKQFQVRDLARMAVLQLRTQHAILKAKEEMLEEMTEIYTQYIK
jgi:hypothetical protein